MHSVNKGVAAVALAAFFGWPPLVVYIIGWSLGMSCTQFEGSCALLSLLVLLAWLTSVYALWKWNPPRDKLQ